MESTRNMGSMESMESMESAESMESMKRKILAVTMAAVVALGAFCLAGCSDQGNDNGANDAGAGVEAEQTEAVAETPAGEQTATISFVIPELSESASPMVMVLASDKSAKEYSIVNGESLTTKALKAGDYELQFYSLPVNPDGTSFQIDEATYVEEPETGDPLYKYAFTVVDGENSVISLTFTKIYPKDMPERMAWVAYNCADQYELADAVEALKPFAKMAQEEEQAE